MNFIGKAATFNLMYAFPLLLLADGGDRLAYVARTVGWALAIWGAGLYWWSAGLYTTQVRRLKSSALGVGETHSADSNSAEGSAFLP